jgi:heterodisulfide reductase subunit C
METIFVVPAEPKPPPGPDSLAAVRERVRPCIQCGTCTASCPNAFAMDLAPRQMWRLVLMGQEDAVLESKTFALCSACYTCTLRCPRGLPLTEAIGELKRLAARRDIPKHRSGAAFYQSFMESVRRHGRVDEMEFMGVYFLRMKNPLLPLRFTGLGLRLLRKGKVVPSIPWPGRGESPLEPIFRKVEEMEAGA